MARNLDLTALRAFAMVAETGGVTKAAGMLNLTQSAVSMQIKRLEESLGRQLFERWGRKLSLSADGELLLGFARQMLAANDEALSRLTDEAFTGEIRLGVPHDIIYPNIPGVLQAFAADFPRVKVTLISSYTRKLLKDYGKGELDVIMTTESAPGPEGEVIAEVPLVWIGAPNGQVWKTRPVRLAFSNNCIFRPLAQKALDDAQIPWEMRVEADSERTIEASISADLAIQAALQGATSPMMATVNHGGALPDLPLMRINLYAAASASGPVAALADMIRACHGAKLAAA